MKYNAAKQRTVSKLRNIQNVPESPDLHKNGSYSIISETRSTSDDENRRKSTRRTEAVAPNSPGEAPTAASNSILLSADRVGSHYSASARPDVSMYFCIHWDISAVFHRCSSQGGIGHLLHLCTARLIPSCTVGSAPKSHSRAQMNELRI